MSHINVDNTEKESTGAVNSIVKAFDTNVSHQNRIDGLELTKFLKRLLNLTPEE